MSKRKKHKRKAKLNYNEIIFVNLKKFSLEKTTSADDKIKAKSLLKWFYANGYFTAAQQALAKSLTYIKKKPAVDKKHYLYAISNGEQVKLGMSSDVDKRLKALQTSSPSDLIVIWKYYVARTSKEAIKIEKMLHRACSEFKIRGEWFSMGCVDIVNKFNPDKKHTAKWEFAKLIHVDNTRKNGILSFTVENIRRTNITSNMQRVWEQKDTAELYQLEVQKYLDDGHVVLVSKL
jgi:hypothetical protein